MNNISITVILQEQKPYIIALYERMDEKAKGRFNRGLPSQSDDLRVAENFEKEGYLVMRFANNEIWNEFGFGEVWFIAHPTKMKEKNTPLIKGILQGLREIIESKEL